MGTAFPIVDATDDVRRLTPWAEPNWVANNDERMSQVLFESMAGPVPHDALAYTPMLRFADTRREAVALLDALTDPSVLRHGRCSRCDRCTGMAPDGESHLWVHMGASVTVVTCCNFCRKSLSFQMPSLVWGTQPPQASE